MGNVGLFKKDVQSIRLNLKTFINMLSFKTSSLGASL